MALARSMHRFASRLARSAGMDEVLCMTVDKQIAEIIRVQCRLRALLD
jgi:hypothetical protein